MIQTTESLCHLGLRQQGYRTDLSMQWRISATLIKQAPDAVKCTIRIGLHVALKQLIFYNHTRASSAEYNTAEPENENVWDNLSIP